MTTARAMTCPRCHGSGAEPATDDHAASVCLSCARCQGARRVPDVQLSDHFWLSEMIESPTAEKLGIPNEPTEATIAAMRELAVDILEPVRDHFGPWRITSGLRVPELNKAIGGSVTSVHDTGNAADGRPLNGAVRLADVVEWIRHSPIPFDQAICEPTWVHLGRRSPRGAVRKEALIMFRDRNPRTGELVSVYAPFDPKHPAIVGS
jgi:zinc D-Ala-D-Ala carboxypeptidase